MTRSAADNTVRDLTFKRVLVISAAQRYLSTESATAPVLASSETKEEAL